MQLSDLLATVLSVLCIGGFVALHEVGPLSVEFFDLRVQILLLLEVDGAILDAAREEVPEAVEVVHEVNEQQQHFDLLPIRHGPGVRIWRGRPQFAQ